MGTLKKSLQTLTSIAAIGGMIAAAPVPAAAQGKNPCAPKSSQQSTNPCAAKGKKAANPCAPKAANPCAPKAANPCAPRK
ncbi:hypothetical protein [Bradyrhizobium sp.]|uniref:hypothetical protein n=1 Tax=Bradyrhizobium sp. TaxID=376 RepID=UPI00403810F9